MACVWFPYGSGWVGPGAVGCVLRTHRSEAVRRDHAPYGQLDSPPAPVKVLATKIGEGDADGQMTGKRGAHR